MIYGYMCLRVVIYVYEIPSDELLLIKGAYFLYGCILSTNK